MKSLTERPAILSIHEDSGDYIIRVGDLKWRPLVAGVSKLLTDARRLIVVTPGDVKFFVVGGDDGPEAVSGAILPDRGLDNDGGSSEVESEEVSQSQLPQPVQEEELPEKPKLTRRRKPLREDVQVGHNESCQRCGGRGTTKTLMPDNSTAESMCPICQGEGVIKRYGTRRQ